MENLAFRIKGKAEIVVKKIELALGMEYVFTYVGRHRISLQKITQ
jgi:hypothetical protein